MDEIKRIGEQIVGVTDKVVREFIKDEVHEKDNKKLNFGCGINILTGWDNVDIQKGKGVFKSFDFDTCPYPIKDNTYDKVLFDFVIEHLSNPKGSLEELHRICKNNARIFIRTPYYNNKGAFTDMTHRSYHTDRSFINFVNEVNQIDKQKRFELVSLALIPTRFGRLLPKNFRRKLSSIIGGVIRLIHVELKVLK
jgi:SAM-dependent methyltransferase